MATFGLSWKMPLFKLRTSVATLGNFWKKLGHFLFQHLVTLSIVVSPSVSHLAGFFPHYKLISIPSTFYYQQIFKKRPFLELPSKCVHAWFFMFSELASFREIEMYSGFLNGPLSAGVPESWVVSHLALIISTLHHSQGREFKPWWWQTLSDPSTISTLSSRFIWFIWFDTVICLSNLSCELWNRKLKINKIYFIINGPLWASFFFTFGFSKQLGRN